MTLVLASASPRRRELLAQLSLTPAGLDFELVSPDIDETPGQGERPTELVQRLAREKAIAGLALCAQLHAPVVLGSDTIVVLGDNMLGKPLDEADARRMLGLLSGNTHTVMTAVALTDGSRTLCRLIQTRVEFCRLTPEVISAYVATREPLDKAGAYGIQGWGGCLVRAIHGSYSAVVGLPLVETRELLHEMGVLWA
jgi:septum formation protein